MFQYCKLLMTLLPLIALTGCVAGPMDLPAPRGVQDAAVEVRGQDTDEADGLLGEWAPSRIYDRAKRAAGYGPNQRKAYDALEAGKALFREASSAQTGKRKKYLTAAKRFSSAADRWPNSAIEEDALFLAAESYFFADHYPEATEAYDAVAKKYENTRYMDTIAKRRFAIADYWIKHQQKNPNWLLTPNLTEDEHPMFDKFGHGIRTLDKIRLQDPTGKLADDATMRAAMANYEEGKYLRADELLADMRRAYPSSEHQFAAHIYGVRCKLKIYQGPSYSMKPMDDAEKLIRQIRIQFPQEAQKNIEFLESAWKEVRKNKALHDWGIAKYYDRRKEFRAARHYYSRVARDYDDTSLAKEARDRLDEIAASPDKPSQKLPWLAEMFPTPEREKPLVASNPFDKLRR